jgi:predicted RNase H-like HicB family nuclease
MEMKLTAVFQKVELGYIGFIEELPGANTQGRTLEETRSNLYEAINLVLSANKELAERDLHGEYIEEKLSLVTL